MASILLICTANVCRSPLAAAILEKLFTDAATAGLAMPATTVTSAGLMAGGQPAHPDTRAVAAELGLDLSDHRSRRVTGDLLASEGTGLIVTMTRGHLREVAVMRPSVWPRAVTLRDLVRRISVDGRDLQSMLATRRPRDVAGDDPADDVADPVGMPVEAHRVLAADLRQMFAVVVRWWQRYGDTL